MKIVIDARYLEGTGGAIGKYIKELVFCAPGDYKFICISSKSLKAKISPAENIIIPERFHSLLWEQIHLPILLYKVKPAIFHAAANYGVPLFCPVKAVVTVHDIIPITTPDYFVTSRFPAVSKILYYLRIQISLIVAKKIIVTNDLLAEELSTKFYVNSQKIAIIPMGINNVQNEEKNMDYIKKITEGKPYLLNHGGIDKRKNLDTLIEVFANIKKMQSKKFKEVRLIITGTNTDLEKELKELVKKLDVKKSVIFVGYVSDGEIGLLIKNATLVIYPTLAEGFGLPAIESLFYETPLVVSNLPIIKQLCKNIPIYIDPTNKKSLYEGIMQGLTKPISKNLLEGGKKIASKYTWENTVKETYRLYKSVLEDK